VTWALPTSPNVSTSRCRLRPFSRLAPSKPCGPPFRWSAHFGCPGPPHWGGVASLTQALLFPQPCKHPLPHPLPTPLPPVVVDRAPGRKVVRQQPPGAPRAQPVQHGVDQLAAVVDRWAATRLGRRGQRRQQRPLRIGQVGRVAATRRSHLYAPYTARNPVERRSLPAFQTPSRPDQGLLAVSGQPVVVVNWNSGVMSSVSVATNTA